MLQDTTRQQELEKKDVSYRKRTLLTIVRETDPCLSSFLRKKTDRKTVRLFSFTFFPRQLGFASSGQTDFTGAHDHFDLWLFDDFDQIGPLQLQGRPEQMA